MKNLLFKFILLFISVLFVVGCSQKPIKIAKPGSFNRPRINSDRAAPSFGGIPIEPRISTTAQLYPSDFRALSGWNRDNHREAFHAFQQSCRRWQRMSPNKAMSGAFDLGRIEDWAQLCTIPVAAGEERQFFETWFQPYAVVDNGSPHGLFTGYYLPELHGSYTRSERYFVPIYRVPRNSALRRKSRAEIYDGALENKGLELVWVDNDIDAFFMEVQGSGRVMMDDGSVLGLGYAGSNGHSYLAIGYELVKRGEMAKEDVTMQTIRAWIDQHPEEGRALMRKNASYVYFRFTNPDPAVGPTGAMGVPLTAQRSLAIDKRYLPLGVPIWLNAQHPTQDNPLQRLVMAQDTGGAIKGAVRGDFYWGQGSQAGEMAGLMKSSGYFYVLLPRHLYGDNAEMARTDSNPTAN
jgi:membrane-bound lytic murein transglycosylase A